MKPAPRPYHHGDLRAALITAAEQLLAEAGYEQLSLREVAKRAGVSPNAPYRHFESKEALVAVVGTRGFQALLARLVQGSRLPPRARLQMALDAYLGFSRQHPGQFRVMFGLTLGCFDAYPELVEAANRAFIELVEIVGAFLPSGTSVLDGVRAAVVAWSLIHGRAVLELDKALDGFDGPSAPGGAELADVVIAGIKALPKSV